MSIRNRNKMLAFIVAASMTLTGVGSLTFAASPAMAKGKKSKSVKKSAKTSAKSSQRNGIHQSNNQSQSAATNQKGGDGGDSGNVTCVNLGGTNVAANVLAVLLGTPGQTADGDQTCSTGKGGDGGDNGSVTFQNQSGTNEANGSQNNNNSGAMSGDALS